MQAPTGVKVLDRFASRRDDEVVYEVYVGADDSIMCTCPGYEYTQKCWHTEKVKGRIAFSKFLGNRFAKIINEQWDYVSQNMGRLR